MREIRELWQYREVLLQLVRRNLKVRYKNSVLGFFWSFLNPLLQILVYWFVFGFVFNVREPNYTAKLLAVFLAWLFFMQTVLDSATCVLQDMPLVKKAYFPRTILPLSTVLSNLLHFCFGFIVLLVIYGLMRVHFTWAFLLVIPLTLLLALFAYGLSLIASSLSVLYSDVKFILSTLMLLWLFLSPILYPVDQVLRTRPEHLTGKMAHLQAALPVIKKLYLLNPLAPVLIGYRSALLGAGENPIPPQFRREFHYPTFFGLSCAVIALTLAVGYFVFRRLEQTFPEHG
jgi:ABC-2 type transport system permease protein